MLENHDLRLAVLIDADNVPRNSMKAIMEEIAVYGNPTIKRIYGDWTDPHVQGWKNPLLEHAITPIQQYGYTTGKNSTDSAMIIDAMDVLYRDNVDGFCIISSDSDFTRLALRLRESGKKVIGFGERKTPKPFVVACDKFIYIEVIRDAAEKAAEKAAAEKAAAEKAAAETAAKTKQKPEKNKKSEKQPEKQESTINGIPLTVVELIVTSIADIADDDGYASLGALGQLLGKKQPDFDSRVYGFSQLSKLVASIQRFELDARGSRDSLSKQMYVRDKQAV
ncbi:MAG: NYN domain-containing protein [Oscillospiraceae bacterium]|jgi:uncharacterized protein (TIGR00288 family)|nr:NYN domain-containing protein [Oscillospiraceae bacterium]